MPAAPDLEGPWAEAEPGALPSWHFPFVGLPSSSHTPGYFIFLILSGQLPVLSSKPLVNSVLLSTRAGLFAAQATQAGPAERYLSRGLSTSQQHVDQSCSDCVAAAENGTEARLPLFPGRAGPCSETMGRLTAMALNFPFSYEVMDGHFFKKTFLVK